MQLIIGTTLAVLACWLNTYSAAHYSETTAKFIVLIPIGIGLLQLFFFLRWSGYIPNKIRNSHERHQELL